jgi:hypothetical protein
MGNFRRLLMKAAIDCKSLPEELVTTPDHRPPGELDRSDPSKIAALAKMLPLPKGTSAVPMVMGSTTVIR